MSDKQNDPAKTQETNSDKPNDNKNCQPVSTTSAQDRQLDEDNIAMEREISVTDDQLENGDEIDDFTESNHSVADIERTYSTM